MNTSIISMKRHFYRVVLYVLAVAVILSGLALTTNPVQAAACTLYHTVKKGENLYRIGLYYGMTWDKLAAMNGIKNPNLIYTGQKLCVSTKNSVKSIPTFTITSVVKDKKVTISTKNFPANQTFNVLMGAYGTQGISGIKVAKTNSGAGGSFMATYKIPKSLQGSYRIAIRLQSISTGIYSYNWFYNHTTK